MSCLQQLPWVACEAGLCRFNEARHLVRGDVVEAIIVSIVKEAVDVGVKPLHDRPQEHRCVSFGATMGVNLDEHPFGPPFHADGYVDPCGKAVGGRQMSGRVVESPVFEAGQHPPDAPSHIEGQWPLEYQQSVFRRGVPDPSRDS